MNDYYHLFNCGRNTNCGSVSLVIQFGLYYLLRNDLYPSLSNLVESQYIDLINCKHTSKNTLVGSICRPTNDNVVII